MKSPSACVSRRRTPPPQERYWRGPVMHDFDGHTWRRATFRSAGRAPAAAAGTGLSLHREPGAAPAQLDIHARLAVAAGICRAALPHQRLHAWCSPIRCRARSMWPRTSYTRRAIAGSRLSRGLRSARYPGCPPIAIRARCSSRKTLRSDAPGRHGLRARRPRHVHAAAVLLHVDAAQARRRFRGRISVRHQARILRPLCLGVRAP